MNVTLTPDESDPRCVKVRCHLDGDDRGEAQLVRREDDMSAATLNPCGEAGDLSLRSGLLFALLEFGFERLHLDRIECEIDPADTARLGSCFAHGFVREGTSRRRDAVTGRAVVRTVLAVQASEWSRRIKPHLATPEARQANLAGLRIVFERDITPELVDAYSRATGDDNPVHLDDAAARAQGFDGRIAHGMLLGGAFSRHFANDFPGPGTIYVSQSLEFLAPVPVGARAAIEFDVLSHIGRRVTVRTRVVVAGEPCVDGVAVLMLPKDFRFARPDRVA